MGFLGRSLDFLRYMRLPYGMVTERIALTALLEMHNKSEIARRLGVDSTTVARWARGDSIPSARDFLELTRLLRVSADLIDLGSAS